MRVLLDINIRVRANEKSEGSARALLLRLIAQNQILLISGEMLVELAQVLRYPRIQELYALTEEEIYNYVQFLREICESVAVDYSLSVPIRDPKDIAVLQTAVIGEADVICTMDSDFYDPDTRALCATAGIEVCTDRELRKRVGL